MRGPGDGNRFSLPTYHALEPREPQPQENRDSVMPRASATQKSSPDGTHLSLESSAVRNGGPLPVEFTGDGQSLSPPLSWHGAPSGTKAYALIMHHLDPEGKTKIYWTLYNIPAELNHLDKNAKGVGIAGCNTINRSLGYAPPHSKGPGAKTYVVTLCPCPTVGRYPAPRSRYRSLAAGGFARSHPCPDRPLFCLHTPWDY